MGWVGIAGAPIASVVWYWYGPPSGSELNVDNTALIQRGMTMEQVEQLLGGPPGDYGYNQGGDEVMMTLELAGIRQPSIKYVWFDDGHWVEVYFDSDGLARFAHERRFVRKRPTIRESLRWRGLAP